MAEPVIIKFKRIKKNLAYIPIPSYSTSGSAGMDVHAGIEEPIFLEPGEVQLVPTNLSVEIPAGFEIQVRPRSGIAAKHSIGILNSPGTIDSDYRGEIKIILINFGKKEFVIKQGESIAQLIVSRVYTAQLTEVKQLNNTSRVEGGFGHTGR